MAWGAPGFHHFASFALALMKLKKSDGMCARETRNVKTACLPDPEFSPGKICQISGWGMTEQGMLHVNGRTTLLPVAIAICDFLLFFLAQSDDLVSSLFKNQLTIQL